MTDDGLPAALVARLLDERARQLARPLAVGAAAADAPAMLVCEAGGERCALPLVAAAAAIAYRGCVAIPGVAAPVLGAIGRRRTLYRIVDVAILLGGEPPEAGGIVLLLASAPLGLRVGRIDGIASVPASAWAESPAGGPVRAVAPTADGIMGALDLDYIHAAAFPRRDKT